MRWVNIGVIVALVAVILIFALQNLESVTMSFLGFRISAPLAVVAVVLYLLGMATGGSVWALMRWAWQGRKTASCRARPAETFRRQRIEPRPECRQRSWPDRSSSGSAVR